MSLLMLWDWGTKELTAAGVDDARWQVELLLRGMLGLSRAKFMTSPELLITAEDTERFRDIIRRRSLGVPVQYILGRQEFYGREFCVTPAVLIPRPETEVLVGEVLKCLQLTAPRLLGNTESPMKPKQPLTSRQPIGDGSQFTVHDSQFTVHSSQLRILDLCTGSGCVGLTLAAEIAQAMVVLTDVSEQALAVAEQNAQRLGLTDRVQLRQGDLFKAVVGEKFDIVVSNPPYIESAAIPTLSMDVQNEPRLALDGGDDGLVFYRRIAREVGQYLHYGGLVNVEIGHGQGQDVMDLFSQAGLMEVTLTHDLAGKERVVTGIGGKGYGNTDRGH